MADDKKAKAADTGDGDGGSDESTQTVGVMINNGDYGGYRSIGRYFANGFTGGVQVTDKELALLKSEPEGIVRVLSGTELSQVGALGKGASSTPALSTEELQALEAFRKAKAAGKAESFLAQAQSLTGTTPGDPAPGSPDDGKSKFKK